MKISNREEYLHRLVSELEQMYYRDPKPLVIKDREFEILLQVIFRRVREFELEW